MYVLIDILNLSHTDGQGLVSISAFDFVDFFDGIGVLGQTGYAIDGVSGDSDHMTLLQCFHRATQDFSTICSSKTQRINEASYATG